MDNQPDTEIREGSRAQRVLADVGLSFAFALLTVLFTNLVGPNSEFDSHKYIIYAKQVSEGNFDRANEFAPLLSWMLGIIEFLLNNMMATLNVYLALTWFILFFAMRIALRAGPLSLGFVFVFLFSNSHSSAQFIYILTEPFFSVLLLVAVVALTSPELFGGPQKKGIWKHHDAVFLTALALLPLQRYVGGFTVVYLSVIYLLMATGIRDLQIRLLRLAAAAVPFSIVLFWNYVATGHFGGFRREVERSFSDNLDLFRDLFVQQFGFEAIVLILSAVVLVAWTFEYRVLWGRRRMIALLLVVLVPFVQLAIQLFAASNFYADPVDTRVYVVILPVTALFALKAVSLISNRFQRSRSQFDPKILREGVWLVVIVGLSWVRAWPEVRPHTTLYEVAARPKLTQAIARPGFDRIALVQGDFLGWFGMDVLTGRLTHHLPCESYTIDGSLRSELFRFKPDCAGVPGPLLVPMVFDTWDGLIAQADAVVFRYFKDGYEEVASIFDTAPSCTSLEILDDNAYRYRHFVLFDLRACRN